MPDRGHELVDLFVRDLDQIELPPRDHWRPTPRKESYLMKTSRYVLYAGAVAAVLVAALIVGLNLRDRSVQVAASPSPIAATSTPIPASSAPATPSPVATASPPPTAQPGAITGRFGYGSDFIPAVTVYAISTTDQRVWYSVDSAGFGNPPRPTIPPGAGQPSYTITGVAPGTYWVVAYRNDGQPLDPGFHDRSAICYRTTPSGPCPDIALAPVTVIAGQTTSGVDVLTWGLPRGQPSPTIPPRPTTTAVGFALPSGCAYAASPVVGTDGSQWKFDCGSTANRDARGTLAPAFMAQGWSACGVGLASGTWMKGDLRLIVTEGSGGAAPAGLPTLTQPARGIQTACG